MLLSKPKHLLVVRKILGIYICIYSLRYIHMILQGQKETLMPSNSSIFLSKMTLEYYFNAK